MFSVGQWIDDQYVVLEKRRGRWWVLYVVVDRISENVFVIKRPSEALLYDSDTPARLTEKAKTWITLGECDELTVAYLVKEFNGVPHVFLEYVDGPSLADILSSRPGKPLPIGQLVGVMKQIVRGMKFLHAASLPGGGSGIVHGGLTPRNILTKAGNIKITDIGLADTLRQSPMMLKAGLLYDEIAYMAPEQIENPQQSDKLTDMYSFGAIMYELATGAPPTRGAKPGKYSNDIIQFEPASPRIRNRSCPRWLEETILKCMAKDARNRFKSFEQLDTFLGEVLKMEEVPQTDSKGEDIPGPTSRVARVRGMAKKESRRLDHYYLGVEHLMLGLIAEEESVVVSCFGDKVTAEQLKSEILSHLPKGEGSWYWEGIRKTPRYNRVMKLARQITRDYGHDLMLPQHILLAILEEGRSIPVRVLKHLGVDVNAATEDLRREVRRKRPAIFVPGSDTPTSRLTSKVLCTTFVPYAPPFAGRRPELERARGLLLEDKKSIMVVGEPGVGKTAFAHELECLVSEASTGPREGYGGLFELRAAALLASSAGEEDIVSTFADIINGIIGENSILLIEDLPAVLGLAVKATGETMARMLDQHITSRGLLLAATSTPSGYAQCESKYPTLSSCLEVINLGELSREETLEILAAAKGALENEHCVTISDEALEAASNLSAKVEGRSLPGAALDALDFACIAAKLHSYAAGQSGVEIIIGAEQVETHLRTEDL